MRARFHYGSGREFFDSGHCTEALGACARGIFFARGTNCPETSSFQGGQQVNLS